MKSYNLGYYNENFTFSADITVGIPESGFSLTIGQSGQVDNLSFSGVSGYLFDASGNFFGGYQKNRPFNISGYFFFEGEEGRYSYFYDNLLVANNMGGLTGYVDNISFEDYGGLNSADLSINLNGAVKDILADNEGILLTANGLFLST